MGFLSDLAKSAGGIVGAGVGFMVGGPAGAAVGFGIGSSVSGAASAISSAKQEKKAIKAQRDQARLQAWQDQMASLRDYQMAVATSGAAWQGSGASLESSGAQGSRSALGSQAATNINLVSQGVGYSNRYFDATRKIARNEGLTQIGNSLGSIFTAATSVMGQPGPKSYSTDTPIQSTGASVWNPTTGSYSMPAGFSNESLFGRG